MKCPNNIHGIALNYPGVSEIKPDRPLYFVKSKGSFCSGGGLVSYPSMTDLFWTEVELGIVLSKDCENIQSSVADSFIQGYVVAADLSCKNISERDHHLAFSKSRQNFCQVSDSMVNLSIREASSLEMRTFVDGTLTQKGSTKDMIFSISECISYLSKITCLRAGDLILTGTPMGWQDNTLSRGSKVRHEIDLVGALTFSVAND